MEVNRKQVLASRLARHQLDGSKRRKVDLLDHGVQDTGRDGSAWALALRGAPRPRAARADAAARKDLWRTIGRPGLVD